LTEHTIEQLTLTKVEIETIELEAMLLTDEELVNIRLWSLMEVVVLLIVEVLHLQNKIQLVYG